MSTRVNISTIDEWMSAAAEMSDPVAALEEAVFLIGELPRCIPPARAGETLDRILDNYATIRCAAGCAMQDVA